MSSFFERGQFTYAVLFMFIFVSLLFAFAFIAPFLQQLTISFFVAGQTSRDIALVEVSKVQDANTRAVLADIIHSSNDAQTFNVDLLGAMATYSGIIIIIVLLLVLFLVSRRNVQVGMIG